MDWYLAVLKKYAQFNGRSRRKEFWFFTLFSALISMALGFADSLLGLPTIGDDYGVLAALYSLFIVIPNIAVIVRRLHDQDRTGWWALIMFVPIVGILVLIYFMVQDSKPGDNRFGPNPKQNEGSFTV
ncbi:MULTISPECIES: DUF805 domain-containing protein [unclassified Photobacterium]|uniref:DUF805 domain-containing protein n=1 Tax=unclassified Photobacterium TaxID=2628852 RepID=UPI000D1635B7|nr:MULTISPECIES: DUF805 domain-containing protein [unclassified Photobacterium]PSV32558.1 DUF805 domain-containing protein [Photobacterium sp. GB-72]PSV40081.1 DUF805 domain-containing protein [Photobacterium sp. GB-210]PSV54531.1 DUF805 domain-containing protein [Photobacterium sp. GB-1]PSW74953.1 DUF805 domain-containing protein [Photobacterium sp. GB-50]